MNNPQLKWIDWTKADINSFWENYYTVLFMEVKHSGQTMNFKFNRGISLQEKQNPFSDIKIPPEKLSIQTQLHSSF